MTVNSSSSTESCYDPEHDAINDAGRLAEVWDAALRASFQLGYDTGFRRGTAVGRDQEATAWQAIITGYAATLDAPTRDALTHARAYSCAPCDTGCGACSSCIHAEYDSSRRRQA